MSTGYNIIQITSEVVGRHDVILCLLDSGVTCYPKTWTIRYLRGWKTTDELQYHLFYLIFFIFQNSVYFKSLYTFTLPTAKFIFIFSNSQVLTT